LPAYTVDASTLLAYLVPESHTPAAQTFFRSLVRVDELFEPSFLFVECTSNLRRKVHEGVLSPDEAGAKLEQALRIQVTLVSDLEQHRRAFEYASTRSTVRAYDEHYLAVASLSGAEIVTIDSGMYQGAVNLRIPARLLR
jgi:predicted nucleic acid-binding protein